jgi:hypothetical protein
MLLISVEIKGLLIEVSVVYLNVRNMTKSKCVGSTVTNHNSVH